MITDLEDSLRTAMRSHTVDVLPPPMLVESARRGGIRRRRRARLITAGLPALVVAAVLGGVTLVPRAGGGLVDAAPAGLPAADEALLARPTQGDLAGDSGYLQAVTAAWRRNYTTSPNADRFDHLIGAPKVLWAGHTPVGPAAIIGQVADLRKQLGKAATDHEIPRLLWGFVGPDARQAPQVVADAFQVPPGAATVEAAFIGPDRSVILVLDRGHPVDLSFVRTYYDDGRVARSWHQVRFPPGGVAVIEPPAGTPPAAVAIRAHAGSQEYAALDNIVDPRHPVDDPIQPRLPWGSAGTNGNQSIWLVGTDPTGSWNRHTPNATTAEKALTDGLGFHAPMLVPDANGYGSSHWYAVGRTPDGSRLVAGEIAIDSDPSHVYAVLRSSGGSVTAVSHLATPTAALPVLLRLPRQQGWLVAQKGAVLRYRTSAAGGWLDAGQNAALLPADAVTVQVTRGGQVTDVPLTG
ncbi:MAG: hypothetical protein V7637_4632 [Mycobacteriales bacterium]